MPVKRALLALIIAAAGLTCGCVSAPQSGTAEDVRLYQPAELAQGQYELIRRLWVESWRTAFWLPNQASEAAAIAALKTEAVRLGANGLISVDCLDQGDFMLFRDVMLFRRQEPAILCYGNAIRVR